MLKINEPTITNLAQDIIRTIPEILTATERSFANLCGTLPKLIKDFAISFNCYKELAASDEAAIFLANNAGYEKRPMSQPVSVDDVSQGHHFQTQETALTNEPEQIMYANG